MIRPVTPEPNWLRHINQAHGEHVLTIDDIARIAHENNRAYCESLGDYSQPKWEDASEHAKTSARSGVRLHLDNPNAGPRASHEEWLKVKIADGWEFAPVTDRDKKKHSCMVPFTELPREQQAKDFLFHGIVHALAPHYLA